MYEHLLSTYLFWELCYTMIQHGPIGEALVICGYWNQLRLNVVWLHGPYLSTHLLKKIQNISISRCSDIEHSHLCRKFYLTVELSPLLDNRIIAKGCRADSHLLNTHYLSAQKSQYPPSSSLLILPVLYIAGYGTRKMREDESICLFWSRRLIA